MEAFGAGNAGTSRHPTFTRKCSSLEYSALTVAELRYRLIGLAQIEITRNLEQISGVSGNVVVDRAATNRISVEPERSDDKINLIAVVQMFNCRVERRIVRPGARDSFSDNWTALEI